MHDSKNVVINTEIYDVRTANNWHPGRRNEGKKETSTLR